MDELPCPCCGFLTLEGGYGSYELCPVCNWEDDGVQLANPTSAGGANLRSLAEAQAIALDSQPLHIESARGYRRSAQWRPLSATEVQLAEARRTTTHWHSEAVLAEAEAYWVVDPRGRSADHG